MEVYNIGMEEDSHLGCNSTHIVLDSLDKCPEFVWQSECKFVCTLTVWMLKFPLLMSILVWDKSIIVCRVQSRVECMQN